jgi:hypothetical protein
MSAVAASALVGLNLSAPAAAALVVGWLAIIAVIMRGIDRAWIAFGQKAKLAHPPEITSP